MRTMIDLVCAYCKISFKREKKFVTCKQNRGQINFVCSKVCQTNLKKTLKPINCPNCKTNFQPTTSQAKYCSSSCFATYFNANPSKKMLDNRKKKSNKCLKCGLLIFASRIYCKPCYETEFYVDEQTTLQEITNKRKYQIHSRVRNLARAKYKRSGRPENCIYCSYSTHYEVCHIKAIKDYPLTATIGEINHLDNLIALCPNHHWELDNGKLTIKQIRSTQLS